MKKTTLSIMNSAITKYQRLEARRANKRSFNPVTLIGRACIEKKIESLFGLSYSPVKDLNCVAYVSSEPNKFCDRLKGTERTLKLDDKWAENVFDCAWMHVTGSFPEGVTANNAVFLINTGGEGLVVDREGREKQAVTCFSSQYDYTLGMPVKRVVLTDGLTDENGNVDFWIDAAANDLFGNLKNGGRLQELSIAIVNEEIRALYYDLQVLVSVYDFGTYDKARNTEAYKKVKSVCRRLKFITADTAKELRAELKPLLDEKNKGDVFTYYGVGHAHLDLAWLWPIRESKRKGARTFSSQLLNISRYPGYIFGASQAQLYQWVKEDYPELFERVRGAINDGSWEVQGATWVEMDSNLTGAESLIRQFYYGKRYFREEFGLDMKILWLPDSFGYSACLPQIMKQADVPYFLTQKMSWNTVNKFPYHTFYWQGLDGSTVFAHMLPENTYNGPCHAVRTTFGERNYQERKISDKSVMLFGIGDGGAGPGFEHIERGRRMENLCGLPKVKFDKALNGLNKLNDGVTAYPTHKGELYLEKHQGTYTTRTQNKRNNRKVEFLLRNYELLAANATELPISLERLDEIWKEILLYQFHDIIPGSSINRVYDECGARYDIIISELKEAINTLLKAQKPTGLFNPAPFSYSRPVAVDGKWIMLNLPNSGIANYKDGSPISSFFAKAERDYIENDLVKVAFRNGEIVSYYDKKSNHEFISAEKPACAYSAYVDNGDCWDIRPVNYYKKSERATCEAFATSASGANAVATSTFKIGNSVITQTATLTDGSPLLRFDIEIDWHGKCKMLRVAFPTTVTAGTAKFNVQFGHISRPTTENNSVEKAQFEVSGQKFVDLSSGDVGISLINDCKFGYRCKGSTIDVDLIRSPKGGPGKDVDQGKQTLTLALYPHSGALGVDTYKEAYILNNPPIPAGTDVAPISYRTDNESVVFETLKVPADGDGIVARFYNCTEDPQTATPKFDGYTAKAIVNILEEKVSEINGTVTLKPFELVNILYE